MDSWTRTQYALATGGIMVGVTAIVLVVLQILNWLLGDPRWLIVIGLVGLVAFLVEWRSRGA